MLTQCSNDESMGAVGSVTPNNLNNTENCVIKLPTKRLTERLLTSQKESVFTRSVNAKDNKNIENVSSN